MSHSRLRRFLTGLGVGYVHTIATIVVGLWLTPFLLRQLGAHDYGLWLLGGQVLVYLALLDLGVVALVPREIAGAVGAADDVHGKQRRLIGETVRLICWQMPFVVLAGAIAILILPAEWAALRSPLSIVVVTFVVTFPLRLFGAILQGLQDLAFLGASQVTAWIAGTVVVVIAVAMNGGLYSLAWGWVGTQLVGAAMNWHRLRANFSEVVPDTIPSLGARTVVRHLKRSGWISVSQLAQVLLAGTDLVVVGELLGPEAVVPYACTAKLPMLLANQPQMFMQMALPALSELRTTASREHLFNVARSMAQVMLLLSGGIVTVVLAVNGSFVAWWVGETRFAGQGLTALILFTMLVRHANATLNYTLFCFGYERRIALTTVSDGLLGLALMLPLVSAFGLHGAVIGSLAAVCLVSVPANLLALAREEGVSPFALFKALGPWSMRFVPIVGAVSVLPLVWTSSGLWSFAPLAAAVGLVYAIVMVPAAQAPPLGPMLMTRLRPWLARVRPLERFAKAAGVPAR
ncbi:MAG TPA: oligosaccharide flippase family protein [Vicinamibacterales bacterium]